MKIAITFILGLGFLAVSLSFLLVYINTHPPTHPLHIVPSTYRADYEAIAFISKDGTVLKGWLLKPLHDVEPAPAIIICHGVGANKSDFTEFGVHLSRRGYAVLLFDFRAHGESGGSRSSLGYHEQDDVLAALGYLQTRREVDSSCIGIYGFSMGGAAALLAAAKTDGFRAVAVDSAFTSLRDQARTAVTEFYHLPAWPFLPLAVLAYEICFRTTIDAVSPVNEIAKISPVPVLVIAGGDDELVPAENGQRLYEAAKEPKELWTVPGAVHGGTLEVSGAAYEERISEFFDKYLRKHNAAR